MLKECFENWNVYRKLISRIAEIALYKSMHSISTHAYCTRVVVYHPPSPSDSVSSPAYWVFLLFTTRKRSLRRLCFYTCLSVILFRGCLPQCILGYTSPRQTPLSRHPPRQTPPQADTPGRHPSHQQTPPRADTPQEQTPSPSGADTPREQTPLQQTPPYPVHSGRYRQQAGGTHPTGMHSCSMIFIYL